MYLSGLKTVSRKLPVLLFLFLLSSQSLFPQSYTVSEKDMRQIETALKEQKSLIERQNIQIKSLTESLNGSIEAMKKQRKLYTGLELENKILRISIPVIAVSSAALAAYITVKVVE